MVKPKLTKRDVGKIVYVYLPTNKSPQFRWITKYNIETKRAYARTPKYGVRLKDLSKKRAKDFGKESILPKNTYKYPSTGKSKKSSKKS